MAITIANLQSISKKINNLSETNEFFNDFWWNTIYDHYFGKSFRAHVLENIRNELVNSNQMKRKIIQALYLKNKVFPKPVSYSLETDIEKYQHDIMVCGKEGSGKNSLILHLIHKQFIQDYGTLADTNYYKIIEVDNVIGMLCIYLNDYVGETIRKVECFIIVCDVNNSESIDQVREEIKIISQYRESDFNNVPIMFVINKIDLLQDSDRNQIEIARELINQEILKYSLNAGIIEASAKTGENVFLIFEELVRKLEFLLLDGTTILRNLIEKESEFIQECKTKYTSKTCSLM